MTEWITDNIPSSGTCMLDLLNNVSFWRDDHPGSVTVVCRLSVSLVIMINKMI
jgi:hypothetical protein